MKKLIILALVSLINTSCLQKEEKVEKLMEDGVEIVINHIEPYKIKGEPRTFSIEEEFVIDTERGDIAELGLTDMRSFNVDSKGNIYVLRSRANKGNYIFKFNKNGNFIISFAGEGQGPGEFQYPPYFTVNYQDNIAITDSIKRKFLLFSKEGNLIMEIPFKANILEVYPLDNGKYLVFYRLIGERNSDYIIQAPLSLWSSEFEEIKELNRYRVLNYFKFNRKKGTSPIFYWRVSGDYIYVGSEDKKYEIFVYDFNGNLLRKIRKEYKEVPIPEEYKNEKMKGLHEEERKITYFPHFFPPYQTFFTDDNGWLFVMTYEKGINISEYIFDIFNPKGIFVGRKILKNINKECATLTTIKQSYFYYIREKENGYKELVVSKMSWE